MYLKSLEIVGFKSFGEKTRLTFEPGMTAIVGPNGCGKSNVSDSIRWVLGEQRVKSIRGSSMTDMIFNGADSHAALNMAEVSLTLADCAEALGTDYDEICVTRRVFRSGESGYFLNKKPCRLKDIQRLFMDTGIGTDSYSIMEQGKIDQILSSRPQDRRDVFEEASGITKYKADKKEALRKLEHTEANLLRLADVIREVKRQIISLQRQAAKAKRYKALQEEVRGLDIYVTRHHIVRLTGKLEEIGGRTAELSKLITELHTSIETEERQVDEGRARLSEIDQAIAAAMDASMQAQSEYERAQQSIRVNTDRIEELKSLAARNTQETEEAQSRLAEHTRNLEEITARTELSEQEKEQTEAELEAANTQLRTVEQQVEEARRTLNTLRNEAVTLDSREAQMQNKLSEMEARDRADILKRERLATEKAELERTLTAYRERGEEMNLRVETLRGSVAEQSTLITSLRDEQSGREQRADELRRQLHTLQNEAAGKKAQLEMLSSTEARSEDFPPGARHLMNEEHEAVIGPLAEQLQAVSDEYQTALAAVLRPWMDTLVVNSGTEAREIISLIENEKLGSARLLTIDGPAKNSPALPAGLQAEPLLSKIKCAETVRPLAERLLNGVFVCETLPEIPQTIPAGTVFVTKNGALFTADGAAESWMPEAGESNPLSRHHLREQLQEELDAIDSKVARLAEEFEALTAHKEELARRIENARQEMEERRHQLSVQEGEMQVIARETQQAQRRMETAAYELEQLIERTGGNEEARTALRGEIDESKKRQMEIRTQVSAGTEQLHLLEEQRTEALNMASERRIIHSQKCQILESLAAQRHQLESRLAELNELIRERTSGVSSYTGRIEQLQAEIEKQSGRLEFLEAAVQTAAQKLAQEKEQREALIALLGEMETKLRRTRSDLEARQSAKAALDIEHTEIRIKFNNTVERITGAYHITMDQVADEPEPEWENGEIPPFAELETRVAEIHAKLESMGPVNLVAIEEYAELEERFAFLNQQEADLVAAKEQLMELIRKINATTTELFTETFNQVNANFQEMFKKVFGGGTAKLVLVDEEDVLESGIEIIARPPGKKLQSISLLSGGERTMTAVALLFSLYMVKPSPFCVLDELDAPLDDANIGRFVETVKSFLDKSQFIVITHSKQTIAAAHTIYGVTMPKKGVSSVVSMKLSDYEKSEEMQR